MYFVMNKKEVRWIWFVYGNTYLSANSTEVICRHYDIPVAAPKFVIVSAVNSITSVIKDRALARMFGKKAPSGLPYASLSLWVFRDMLTVISAFILPPIMSKYMVSLGYNESRSETIAYAMSPILL